mmetsp:Transcript_7967/g.49205  ORF Transcript_7967/g.49205 Transcript_7967/m.49205 type:complete len:122 (+) Transcript_7967:907-1272(+)
MDAGSLHLCLGLNFHAYIGTAGSLVSMETPVLGRNCGCLLVLWSSLSVLSTTGGSWLYSSGCKICSSAQTSERTVSLLAMVLDRKDGSANSQVLEPSIILSFASKIDCLYWADDHSSPSSY